MNPDLWTWEQHPAGWNPAVIVWHAVAPKSDPKAGHPSRYPFGRLLPDGRRAYPFTGPWAARQAAEVANARIGAP